MTMPRQPDDPGPSEPRATTWTTPDLARHLRHLALHGPSALTTQDVVALLTATIRLSDLRIAFIGGACAGVALMCVVVLMIGAV